MRRIGTLLGGCALIGTFVVASQSAAYADYVYCPPDHGACYIVVTGPGDGGGDDGGGDGGGGGGGGRCTVRDEQHEQLREVPCYSPSMGWFNPTNTCYYQQIELNGDDPAWHGNDPAGGFMYHVRCWAGLSGAWEIVDTVYLSSPPPGYGGMPSPISLAVQAINALPIDGPEINIRPEPTGSGLVGLPVWMWTSAAYWEPLSETASVPGLSVTATAHPTRITWNMGDGNVIVCDSPGTEYFPRYGDRSSPDCGHKFTKPSRDAGGRYTITATTTYQVDWAGGGDSGSLQVERSSTTSVLINELQVVVQ